MYIGSLRRRLLGTDCLFINSILKLINNTIYIKWKFLCDPIMYTESTKSDEIPCQ